MNLPQTDPVMDFKFQKAFAGMAPSGPMVLLAPGLDKRIRKEVAGMTIFIAHEFDKVVVHMGENSVDISRAQLIEAFQNDDYVAIDRAVVGAVRHLKSMAYLKLRFARGRAFRTKQRSILIHRR